MARGRGGLDPATAKQEGQAEAGEAECGLGVLSEAQLLIVCVDQQVAKVDAGDSGAFVAELLDLGVSEHLDPHAWLLRALAGVKKRDFRGYAVWITSRPA
jgi:hypothetical protein